jgi:hypothetical protein
MKAWLPLLAVGLAGIVASSRQVTGLKPDEPEPAIPPEYRRMKDGEVSDELKAAAPAFLSLPYGSVVPVPNIADQDVLAGIELHFHTPGGPVKPWGWHKGVSLFIRDEANA